MIRGYELRVRLIEQSTALAEMALALDVTESDAERPWDDSVDYALANEAHRIIRRLSPVQRRVIAEADPLGQVYCPPARGALLHDLRLITTRMDTLPRLTVLGQKVSEIIAVRGAA